MKRAGLAVVLCICCLLSISGPATAGYFDGMEAYRQNDYKTALREFKAAEDDVKAMYMIGIIYEKGEGVAIDYAEAVQWYRKAADKGNSAAQYRLGRLFERGLGVEQSREEAIKWYKKSAKQGYVDARQVLKRIDTK
jgi:TPR repeat protein